MANIKIALSNQSTVLTDAQVQAAIAPVQIQVSQHFAHVWGVDAELSFVPRDRVSSHHQFKPFLSSLAVSPHCMANKQVSVSRCRGGSLGNKSISSL
jgi:hypothetical protein